MGTPRRPVPDDWERTHAALRDALLRRTAATLEADERFVAAWLAGSFGRGRRTTSATSTRRSSRPPPPAPSAPAPGAARGAPRPSASLIETIGRPALLAGPTRT